MTSLGDLFGELGDAEAEHALLLERFAPLDEPFPFALAWDARLAGRLIGEGITARVNPEALRRP